MLAQKERVDKSPVSCWVVPPLIETVDRKENYSKNMLAMMTLPSTKSIKLKTYVGMEWSMCNERAGMNNMSGIDGICKDAGKQMCRMEEWERKKEEGRPDIYGPPWEVVIALKGKVLSRHNNSVIIRFVPNPVKRKIFTLRSYNTILDPTGSFQ